MKKLIPIAATALFIVIIISCQGDKSIVLQAAPEIEFKIDAVKVGVLRIPLDSLSTNRPVAFQKLTKNGIDYFTFLNHHTNSIYYYNLDTRMYDSIQHFVKDGPNGLGKFDSTIKYEFLGDSMMFYSRSRLEMIIVDSKKNVVFRYNFGKEGKTAPYGMTRGWFFNSGTGFNFSTIAQTPYVKLDNLPDSLEFEFSLKTQKIKKEYSPLPIAYKNEMWMLEQLRYHRAENDKVRIYSYPIDPQVQFKKLDGSFGSKYFGSRLVKAITPIGSVKIAQDIQASGKYYFSQGRYGHVYYDPFRKLFLRAGYSGMNEDNVDINNPFGDTTNFNKVLVIGDEAVNLIGELQNDLMIEWVVFFQEDGIYVLVDSQDENNLTFDIYNIKER
ncbi:MAG: hypothetical protein COW03_12255 [Cytophagales bacterium CG12_big_fil_rev_8_21_14_0_65_40_12]|nr:MAG: hypothetical protein COW03_12255 [Cytophagales bacterium CG12_big_fil_rev_8_21_14_0_65_40_12]PIW04869.1 MAG: hypothetical protein COW40_07340 [Cytophagales bacterium CG17_big_fil_post_rev_8_21_14_2_50_40_13]